MKKDPKRKFPLSSIKMILKTWEKPSKAQVREYRVGDRFACSNCGENRKDKICTLRSGFYSCETCGGTFIVSDSLDSKLFKEPKHEEE